MRRRKADNRRVAGTRHQPPTPAEVAEWLKSATPDKLVELAGRGIDARKLLFVAREAMDAHSDAEINDLALEVDDILRRFRSEEAASKRR